MFFKKFFLPVLMKDLVRETIKFKVTTQQVSASKEDKCIWEPRITVAE